MECDASQTQNALAVVILVNEHSTGAQWAGLLNMVGEGC